MFERLNKRFFVSQWTDEFFCEFALPQRIFTIVQLSFSIRSNVPHHYLQTFQIKNLNFLYDLHFFKRNDSTSLEKRILCERIVSMHDVSYSQVKSFHRKNERTKMKRCVTNSSFTFVKRTILWKCWHCLWWERLAADRTRGEDLLNSCCRCFSHQILSNVASRHLTKSICATISQTDEDLQIISLPSLVVKARFSLKLNNNRCFSLIGKQIEQPTTMNNSFTIPFTFNRHITKGHWPIHHRQSTNSLGRRTFFIFTLQQYSQMENFLQ